MIYIFLAVGTLAAFSTNSELPKYSNYSYVAITAVCYGLAVILKIFGGNNGR